MTKLFASLTIFLFLGFDRCSEEENATTGKCIEVSIVASICGNAVLKIEDPGYYHLGETWNDHQNVFYTFFGCSVKEAELAGKKFFVTLEKEQTDIDCARCLAALDYNGQKKYFVRVHEVCVGGGANE